MRTIPGVALAFLLVAGAGRAADRPDWISGESLEWPRHWYIVGVGIADERAAAEDRARAEVARVFQTRVVANTTSFASEATATMDGRSSTASSAAVSDDARSSADKVLQGVEIVASWQDPATRQMFVLAALDKRSASRRLQSELAAVDALVQPEEAQLAAATDPVDRALAGMRILSTLRRRDPILADLRIVDSSAQVAGADRYARLSGAASSAVSALVVATAVTGDETTAVAEGISRGLGALGLRSVDALAASGAQPDLSVEATSAIEDLGKRQGWFWSRTTATVIVRESRTSKILFQSDASARESATIASEARHRAGRSVGKLVAQKIQAGLLSWATETTGR